MNPLIPAIHKVTLNLSATIQQVRALPTVFVCLSRQLLPTVIVDAAVVIRAPET
jgi:hypothetical protein